MSEEKQQSILEENPDHIAAHFAFLPFAVHLLSQKQLQSGVHPLPLNTPEALTQETLKAIQDIVNQGTVSYLSRSAGWNKKAVVLPHQERPRKKRLWDADIWKQLKLQFTHESLEALLIAYNLTRKVPKAFELKKGNASALLAGHRQRDPMLMLAQKKGLSTHELTEQIEHVQQSSIRTLQTLTLHSNGDALIHHQVCQSLNQWIALDQTTQNALLRNPLNLFTHFYVSASITEQHIDTLKAILKPSLAPILPWLGDIWVRHWIDIEPKRWNAPKKQQLQVFHQFCENQDLLFTAWYTLADEEERFEILIPMLHYYTEYIKTYPSTQSIAEQFSTLTRELRHIEKNTYKDVFARALLPALLLRKVYEEARDLHPVEREACHHLFMEEYQICQFEEVLKTVEERIEWLQPTLG